MTRKTLPHAHRKISNSDSGVGYCPEDRVLQLTRKDGHFNLAKTMCRFVRFCEVA